MMRFLLIFILLTSAFAAQNPDPKAAGQNPSPMVEHTRAHGRVPKTEIPGKRFTLSIGTLLLPESAHLKYTMPLYIHFHGSSWLAEKSVHDVNPKTVVLTVNLGVGSGVYAKAFTDPQRFSQLLDEAARALDPQHPPQFKPIVLSSFSAGYGATREILKNHDNWPRIDAVVLADGLHTGYLTADGQPDAIDPAPLQPFLDFARAATEGKKHMVITHSEIFPGTFASTTETADYLLDQLNLKAKPVLKWGPGGMQQLSELHVGHFWMLGFAGNSAPDHIDQFHGMAKWLKLATRG